MNFDNKQLLKGDIAEIKMPFEAPFTNINCEEETRLVLTDSADFVDAFLKSPTAWRQKQNSL